MVRYSIIGILAFLFAGAAWAGPLELTSTDDVGISYYAPARASLSAEPVEDLVSEPEYTGTPLYGALEVGNAEDSTFAIVLDSWLDDDNALQTKLYIDANNDEDLTNDGDGTWDQDRGRVMLAETTLNVGYEGTAGTIDYPFTLYHFRVTEGLDEGLSRNEVQAAWDTAKEEDMRATTVFFYRNAVRHGEVEIAGETVEIVLVDDDSDGLYDDMIAEGDGDPAGSGAIVVDRDQNGELGTSSDSAEFYSADEPFEFEGTGYRLAYVSPSGDEVRFEETDEYVVKQYIEAGYPIVDFETTDINGETFKLSDYEGKVVLLDFWASWCGPCIAEMPNVIAAYEEWNDKGFEIIGISLDRSLEDMNKYLAENPDMTWRQVCDEGFWDAEIADLWRVNAIPAPFLIDQNGVIYGKVRGSQLEEALEELLG